jgi:hypothetical protein
VRQATLGQPHALSWRTGIEREPETGTISARDYAQNQIATLIEVEHPVRTVWERAHGELPTVYASTVIRPGLGSASGPLARGTRDTARSSQTVRGAELGLSGALAEAAVADDVDAAAVATVVTLLVGICFHAAPLLVRRPPEATVLAVRLPAEQLAFALGGLPASLTEFLGVLAGQRSSAPEPGQSQSETGGRYGLDGSPSCAGR